MPLAGLVTCLSTAAFAQDGVDAAAGYDLPAAGPNNSMASSKEAPDIETIDAGIPPPTTEVVVHALPRRAEGVRDGTRVAYITRQDDVRKTGGVQSLADALRDHPGASAQQTTPGQGTIYGGKEDQWVPSGPRG